MRIALFTDSFFPELGGIQDSIMATTRALGERGHQVRIYAPTASRKDYEIAGLPPVEVDLGPNVDICRLLSVAVPSSTRQSRLVVPTGRRWRRLAAFRPDIIHAHTFFGAGWEALRAARRLQTPIVGTNHWAIGEFSAYVPLTAAAFGRVSLKLVTAYYNRCAFVTGPSRSVLEEMQAFGLKKPHRVISNPIDTDVFRPATPCEKRALKQKHGFSAATIVYAGRLAIEKNIDDLIRAVAVLVPDIPDIELVLAGHGTAQRPLQRLAHGLGIAQRVRFLGTLGKADLAEVFRAADVFAIASTSETQSMTLLQAMSSGLPAVGARWRALPEYITADAGLLAEPGAPEDFAGKLMTILMQPALQEHMQVHTRRIATGYSISSVVDRWEDIYAATAKNHNGSLFAQSNHLEIEEGLTP